jgi:hypothetical protein
MEESHKSDVILVSNLMALNNLGVKDAYRLPEMRKITGVTAGAEFMMMIYLREGYYHVEIEEERKHKTAFEFEDKADECNGNGI